MSARGLDLAPDNQPLARLRLADWAAAGVRYGWVEYVRDGQALAGAANERAALHAAGLATAGYVNLGPGDGAAQMGLFLALSPAGELPDLLDVEETRLTEPQIRAACLAHDASGRQLVLYTGYWTWQRIVPLPARAFYQKYKVVIAAYPNDAAPTSDGRDSQPMDDASVARRSTPPAVFNVAVPAPWVAADVFSWQYTGHGSLAGYAGFLDLHLAGPAFTAQGITTMRMPTVMVPRGSLVAIHAINPGHTLERVKEAVAAGAPYAAVKLLNDAAALMQIKQASPTTWCYLRYFDPADDSLQGLDDWSEANEDAWCDRVLYMIYSQITAEQCRWIDWVMAWNEEDPPGKWGYAKLGQTFLKLGRKNEQRRAAGQTYVKLCFGALAQGTPELWEMDELYDTGLFAWMHDHFYSWDDHEGWYEWQPDLETGMGDKLPSTPEIKALGEGHGDVPAIPGSGSGNFRFVWLFERRLRPAGQLVPLLIGEWYPGVLGQLGRYWWYDDRVCLYEYVTGFAGYNYGQTPDWPDLSAAYESDDFKNHRIAIRRRVNGGLMKNVSDTDFAALVAANQSEAVILAKYSAPAKHTLADRTNQFVFNLFQAALGGVGLLDTRGLSGGMAAHRDALYSGPALEDLGLTPAQLAALIAALGAA